MDAAELARFNAVRRQEGKFGHQKHRAPEPASAEQSDSWPAARFEEYPWDSSDDAMMSRRARQRARGPFRVSIPPFISSERVDIPSAVAAEAGDAHAALSRFDQEVGTLNAPLLPILLRSESSASSEVERLTASAKQIALAQLGDSQSGNADLIVANSRAMESAIALANQLDTDSVIQMHGPLLGRSQPGIVGAFRDVHVWVGGDTPHTARHVGPAPERVRALMDDLMAFANRTDVPVLPHIAVAHAQFETIHPFPDGNGRTGRALVHAMLHASGTTRQVTVPVSAGLLSDTEAYFDALTAYGQGDPVPIVEVFTDASFRSLTNSKQLVRDLEEAQAEWSQRLAARRGSSARRALDILPRQPVVTVKHLAEQLQVSETAASSAIDSLVGADVLRQTSTGQRNRHFQANAVLEALDSFAERARRQRA